ncbi:MAG: nitrophenyl compound nitroreductase subunit ArsF family protein [Dehalococcoidia bacterium]
MLPAKTISVILLPCLIAVSFCSCNQAFSEYTINNADTSAQITGPSDKVELVYFHRPNRCEACTYAEERVSYLVNTYFQDETDSGKLTFTIYNIGDKESAPAAERYGAIGSQLFVNSIINGKDYIRYVDEIWYWGCIDNEEVFDATVKEIIAKALYGEK